MCGVAHIWNLSRRPVDLANDDGQVIARWPVIGHVRLVEQAYEEPAVSVGSLTLPVSGLRLERFEFSGVTIEKLQPGDVVIVEREHLGAMRAAVGDLARVLCAEGAIQDGGVRLVHLCG